MGPDASPIRALATVREVADEGGVNRRLRLSLADWPGATPGQFVMLSPGAQTAAPRWDPLLPRPMAVYREVPGAPATIEILLKVHGRGTALLGEMLPGQRVRVVGPLGRGFELPAAGRRAVVVAGGTGIASVYGLALHCMRVDGPPPVVLLGARTAVDLMGEADFAALGIDLQVATEDGSRGSRGLVTELLEAELARADDVHVFACGPTPMMRRAALLAARHAAPCSVSLENPMACGFGVCLGCAAPLRAGGFALVCRDGPVLDAARVAWEGLA